MSQDRVMLLIDADNVSIDIMEQAVQLLHKQHGGVHVRRAYCTAESAMKHQAAFKRMGIKPMVNLAAGKNSTDIALAVDAIDLVLAERPDVVVIASSDSDFAPLVQRLREKGCEVRGIGQLGKTGQETQDVYDDYTVLEHRKAVAGASSDAADAPARKPARKAAVKKTVAAKKSPAAKKAVAKKAVAKKAPARKAAARKSEAQATAAAAVPASAAVPAAEPEPAATAVADSAPGAAAAPSRPDGEAAPASGSGASGGGASGGGRSTRRATLAAVLGCLPELEAGKSLPLNTAARRLRDEQLLGQNSSSLKLFAAWPERFELVPANQPSQVRLRGG